MGSEAMERVRPAAVAGLFYPKERSTLETEVERLLAGTMAAPGAAGPPKALIVPHAGYVYSGPVAASAYGLLAGARGIRRVVLLGPVHRVPVRGLALPDTDVFATPLGRIPVDGEWARRLDGMPQVCVNGTAHAPEHSLEVQLPFLQHQLGTFSLVPLAVGDATPAEVAECLERLWGGPETLIVVSSDLSHYLPYDVARRVDHDTAEAILAYKEGSIGHEHACGATPVWGLLLVARRRGLTVTLLDLRSSGDTEGDRDRVVGYGAFAFREAA
jgi:AmmeMemoRadiSam system protein B